jgi:hypothetical protein
VVGSEGFVEQVKIELGFGAKNRQFRWQPVGLDFDSRCRLMPIILLGKMKL